MNVLDWALLALVLAYAVSGYWQGLVSGAFATAGLLLGGLAGMWLAPRLLGESGSSVLVSLGALLVVLVCATLGQGLLQLVGTRIRSRITWQPARALDAVGGALLSVLAVLVVAWALGLAVTDASVPWLSREARASQVLRKVDSMMPAVAVQVLDSFDDLVGSSFFPRYLEPFATERIPGVAAPPPRIARDPDVDRAAESVVKVRGENACGKGVEGTGFVYGRGRVMTNAHVVAGVDAPTVLVGGRELDASVVHYDPDVDIAVLAVDGMLAPALRFAESAEPGDPGAVLGFPNDGPYDVQAARVRDEQRLRSPDIYGGGVVVRRVFSLRSQIRPGNSGGPVVSRDGEVIGVVFAASEADEDTGYALTADQVAASAAAGLDADSPVSTGACA